MKASLRHNLFLLSSIVFAINAALGLIVYKSNARLLDSEQWVQHTGNVMSQVADIQAISNETETASSGFVITGGTSLLNPLLTAPKTFFAGLLHLKKLTADNPKQQKRVDSLRSYMKSYFDFLLNKVEEQNKHRQAPIKFSATAGTLYTGHIRQLTLAILGEENNLLIDRKKVYLNNVAIFHRGIFIILILITGLIVLLVVFISKYLLQVKEKEDGATELIMANKKLFFQNEEKEKRAAELVIANEELSFQNEEKEKRAAELVIANKELSFQNEEKEKRAAELVIANKELSFQNMEKEKRAGELLIANKELFFQNTEKGNRASELSIANKELSFQNSEKESRAAELVIANEELFFQNSEKESRAAELVIANEELSYQNTEKESRAAELAIANQELFFQNTEKEKRANELIIANLELLFQNQEKESRAAELAVANEELVYQNREKEKRAAELKKANRLYAFLSEINQNIVREKNEPGLFRNACSIARDFGKFKIAWIGLFNDDRNAITQIAQAGIPNEVIAQFENVPLQPGGPQSRVLQTGAYYICNDIMNDDELESWSALAVTQKVNSCIILPIKKSAKIIGTFNLYAAEMNFFNQEELGLLVEVTGDISFALDMFEREKVLVQTRELVIENEKRFHSLIEKSADMITLSEQTGEFIYASGSITRGLGYSVDELLQMSVFDIIHPDDIPRAIQNRDIILKTPGQSYYYQQRRKHKNGTWIWCEGSLTNMLNEPGIHALVSNFRDVSDKKTAEIRKEYDKNNMDALMNNSNDLMWSVGTDFKMITSNTPFDDFMKENGGKTVKQGVNILKTSSTDKESNLYKSFYERAFAGESFTEIVYHDMPYNTWAEISFCPIHNGDEVIGTACHSHDITDRKAIETSLTEAQAIARLGNFEINMVNYTEEWADQMYEILGLEKTGNGPAEPFSSYIHPDDLPVAMEAFHSRQSSSMDYRLVRKDGVLRYVNCEWKFELDSTGKPMRLYGVLQDITERKQGEIDKKNLVNDLLLRNTELEQFAYVASHDLQEPLRMITSFMTQLEKKYSAVVDEKGRKYIHFAVDGARRMRQIILDLLDFSRVGKTEDDLEEVDFNNLMKEILALYRRQIEEAEAQVTFKNLPTISTYKTPLRQVFQNLIGNSLKYQKEGVAPLISITCSETKEWYQFAVKDNGIGIAPEYLEKIFIIFQRLHNKDEYSGTGMGLAIVKKIAENMGGKTWAESNEGEGSTFYFTMIKTKEK